MNVLKNILIQIITILIQSVICGYDQRVITSLKYSKYSLTPAVVNGKPVKDGEFPFLVSIKEPLQTIEPCNVVWGNVCGGSIIAKTKVLSAAHCFENDKFYFEKHPGVLRVVAGNLNTDILHDGQTETTANGQWRTILRAILHQDYHFPDNDIAIAVVDKPWVYNKNVKPVRLASSMVDYQGNCISAGYGMLGFKPNDKISQVMLSAEIETVSKWRCSLLWEMNMDSFVCSASAISDVARGDSGGPLLCRRTGDPEEVNDEGILAGVVSGKNFDTTTLYTRVSEFRAWIASDGAPRDGMIYRGAAHKLHVSVNVCWSIILFVLIYLLFYCLGFSSPHRGLWCFSWIIGKGSRLNYTSHTG